MTGGSFPRRSLGLLQGDGVVVWGSQGCLGGEGPGWRLDVLTLQGHEVGCEDEKTLRGLALRDSRLSWGRDGQQGIGKFAVRQCAQGCTGVRLRDPLRGQQALPEKGGVAGGCQGGFQKGGDLGPRKMNRVLPGGGTGMEPCSEVILKNSKFGRDQKKESGAM